MVRVEEMYPRPKARYSRELVIPEELWEYINSYYKKWIKSCNNAYIWKKRGGNHG